MTSKAFGPTLLPTMSHLGSNTLHVSLVALPDAVISTLAGILDVMNGAALMNLGDAKATPPFQIEITESFNVRISRPGLTTDSTDSHG